MHRTETIEKLKIYLNAYPDERVIINQFLSFVIKNKDCFERELLIGHITASAWVLNNKANSALLTHHKKLNKWLQLGGHTDGKPNTLESAMRELHEESGLENIEVVSTDIFDIDAHIIPAQGNEPEHTHYDIRYLFKTNGDEQYSVSDESHDLAWVKLSEVKNFNCTDSVLRMISKTKLFF